MATISTYQNEIVGMKIMNGNTLHTGPDMDSVWGSVWKLVSCKTSFNSNHKSFIQD